jgi:hypothetical protein
MYGNNEGLERNITDILARMRKQRMPKENIDVIVSWVNFLKAKGAASPLTHFWFINHSFICQF